MYRQVAVNPGQIVINDGATFLVSAADGTIDDQQAQGFFAHDTRLISYYQMYLNRKRLTLLASSSIDHHSALYVFTNPQLETIAGSLSENCLVIKLRRDISGGMHEDIDIANWHTEPVSVDLAVAIRSDFADLFQVKANKILTHGEIATDWDEGRLVIAYRNGDFRRKLNISSQNESSPLRNANGRLTFRVPLQPGEEWHVCLNYEVETNDEVLSPKSTCRESHDSEGGRIKKSFIDSATRITTAHAGVTEAYSQAVDDMGALQIQVKAKEGKAWMPAAGVPWFMAVFGRDSILVSLQTLPAHREFAEATLRKLAALQATEVDDWRDAQPGKMPHELRCGELTQLGKLPYSPYYGTVDATPLWIIALADAYQWGGDKKLLRDCEKSLSNALDWIENYGDLDDDGFIEYQTRSTDGTQNQGWKDSGKAIVHADGSQAEAPIALCEVQGEVYSAWLKAAAIYECLGKDKRASELRQKARRLYEHLNECFWMEKEQFYCLGLDADKQPIRSIASNAGQLLWTGMVPEDRAKLLVQRLFAEDMWCGWGVRTLSSNNPAYNPLSYQRGNVWPMDNGLIALGMQRYGYHRQAAQIAEGIFAAAEFFQGSRLPEAYAGEQRTSRSFPIPYINANSPQGWSSGAIIQLTFLMLGLNAEAPQRRLAIDPHLPDWLAELSVENLTVGEATANLRFWREGNDTQYEVTSVQGDLTVERVWSAGSAHA